MACRGWLGMAKRGPWLTDGEPVLEPGEVLFEFGATQEEARARIEEDVRRSSN